MLFQKIGGSREAAPRARAPQLVRQPPAPPAPAVLHALAAPEANAGRAADVVLAVETASAGVAEIFWGSFVQDSRSRFVVVGVPRARVEQVVSFGADAHARAPMTSSTSVVGVRVDDIGNPLAALGVCADVHHGGSSCCHHPMFWATWFAYHGLFTQFLVRAVGSEFASWDTTTSKLVLWPACALVHTLPCMILVHHAGDKLLGVHAIESFVVSVLASVALALRHTPMRSARELCTGGLGLCAVHLVASGGMVFRLAGFVLWCAAEWVCLPHRDVLVYGPLGVAGFVNLALHVPVLAFGSVVFIFQHLAPGSTFTESLWICFLGAGMAVDAYLESQV